LLLIWVIRRRIIFSILKTKNKTPTTNPINQTNPTNINQSNPTNINQTNPANINQTNQTS
jgi:hypothetical protein